VRHRPFSSVVRIVPAGDAVEVTLAVPGGEEVIPVDRIVAQTGFRPDHALSRELQMHECYASQGPMKLAAALLGAGGADCMEQSGFGPESLLNPEPGFFLVGHKSYGRNPEFLLRVGREQVRDVFRLLSGDARLDLYREEAAHA
jgi:hypothetical protein